MSDDPSHELTDDEARVMVLALQLGYGRFLRAFHGLGRRGLIHTHADGITINSLDEREGERPPSAPERARRFWLASRPFS